MRALASKEWLLVGIVVLGCGPTDSQSDAGEATEPLEAQQTYERVLGRYEAAVEDLEQSIPVIAGPLRGLTEEQQASLAAVLIATRTLARAEVLSDSGRLAISDDYWAELQAICPPLRSFSFSRGGCWAAEVAYASAAASCESGDDADCVETWEAAAALAECQLQQLDNLASAIRAVPGRPWPPQPFPWESGADMPGTRGSPPR
jgi:hypothetical protein